MERVGRIHPSGAGAVLVNGCCCGGPASSSSTKLGAGSESSRAITRLPISLSTIVIDRLPRAGLRVGRLKRRSSSLTRFSVVAAAAAAAAAASVDTAYAPERLVDDAKRSRKPRRRKDALANAESNATVPISAATTKNLASTDKELLRLARALENAYFQDSPLPSLPTELPDKSSSVMLDDLVTQIRPVAIDGSIDYTTPTTSSSSAPSASTKVKKKRGRKVAASRSIEHLPQQPSMDINQNQNQNASGRFSPAESPPARAATAGEVTGKRRLNLVSRIALRRKRQELSKKDLDANVKISKDGHDIWSEDAEKLITKYASSLDFGVVDWDSLSRDLLSAEEEYSLASLMKPAKKLEKTFKAIGEELGRDPSDEEWAKAAQLDVHTLKRQVLLGRAARNKLIQHNLRLVLFQAHKYQKDNSSLSLFDLCQEGVSGLLHGVDKFDPKRGHRFSTYAVYWVRNSILRAMTRSGSVLRSPYNVAMHKWNIKRARLDLLVELERAATDAEVMERLGIAPDRFRDIVRSSTRARSIHQRSLLTGEEFVENIVDSQNRDGHSAAADTALLSIDDVLDSLKPKESFVLSQRFGLDGKGERTLSEIGKNMNLSREMVRRYEACGLLKMKHPTRLDYLRNYLATET
uniref:Sigma factor 5 n=1 Tax=Marchantia polymorpha TaxID=3197 RepID=K0IYG9_MARPO|nr:sigma factor 5 [Marchantia polymorpha]